MRDGRFSNRGGRVRHCRQSAPFQREDASHVRDDRVYCSINCTIVEALAITSRFALPRHSTQVPRPQRGAPASVRLGTESLYFNGGRNDIMKFTRLDAGDFDTVEFQVGTGYAGPNMFAWITVWNNGGQVASFDVDTTFGTYLGITGGGFDEVRFQAHVAAGTRDLDIEITFGAGAVDNFSYGVIPAPGAIALLGLAGLVSKRRRR